MRRKGSGAVAALTGLLLAAAVQAQPKISVEPYAVVIDDITPGANVAWLSVARESVDEWRVLVVRRDGIEADADRDGTVQIKLEEEVPPASVWIVFDMTTGAAAVGAPEGFDLRPITQSLVDLKHAAAGVADLAAEDHELVELLLVRPGAGAWALTVGDGGASDADGKRDGGIAVVAGGMKALSAATAVDAPTSLRAGDAFAVIDTQSLQYLVATVPAGAK